MLKHLFFLIIFLVGCSSRVLPSTSEIEKPSSSATVIALSVTPSFSSTLTASLSPTQASFVTPTLVSSPVATSTPSPVPFATPTMTAIPRIQAIISVSSANIRSGPGEVFSVLVNFARGITIDVLGRSADSLWLYVDLTLGQVGWVIKDSIEIDIDIDSLKLIEAPPPPTITPTPPAIPQLLAWRNEDNLIVQFKNFQPGEAITVEVIQTSTNKVLATRTDIVYKDNVYSVTTFGTQNFPTNTLLLIVAQGDKGSFAQTMITLTDQ